MKKTLIAGAASVALAALPMAGVFATDPISVETGQSLTDSFTVTIQHSCTMSRKSGAAHGAGTWNPSGTDSDTLALGSITSGARYSMGSSTFNVKCNGTNGYTVTAVVDNFDGPRAVDNINAINTAIPEQPTTSAWTAVSTYAPTAGNPAYVTATTGGDTVMARNAATANAGDDFTMTYTLGLKDGQASGTYNASITYTLTDMNPSTGA